MSFASRWKGIGRPASGGATLNWKPPRRPHKRPPKKGLQNGVRDRNRHRDRSAPRHGRRRRVGPRGHRDGCAPHGDACGGPASWNNDSTPIPRRGTGRARRLTIATDIVGDIPVNAYRSIPSREGSTLFFVAPTCSQIDNDNNAEMRFSGPDSNMVGLLPGDARIPRKGTLRGSARNRP